MRSMQELQHDWPMGTEIHKLESRLWHLARQEGRKALVVTSPLRGEGKSTTVAYLATALGFHPGRRVLAVDMDFREPSLNRYFELEASNGLADVLRGECRLSDAICPTPLGGLNVLLPGEHELDPALVVNSSEMGDIFDALREEYDIVLVDSPALIPVPDASALIPHSDGVILAVMAGLTTKHHLTRARELVLGLGGTILGLVVGNVQEAAPEYLDSHYFAYGPNHRPRSENGKRA